MSARGVSGAHPPVSIDVVICTYNRAADLDRVLASLAAQQHTESLGWSILVVDNASTDNTRCVVDAWRERGALPHLNYVLEPVQGLSHARAKGFRETTATWIAFIDDDNLLASDWLAEMGEAINAQPDAGGLGGRVILDWIGPRRTYLDKLGWCFAEQDHGTEMREIDNLVGAGMVLRRRALEDSGWPHFMLLEDRTGAKLVSGGDVEMVQRVKLSGHQLWYAPRCILKHRIGSDRAGRKHVVRLAFGLGRGAARVSAVCSTADSIVWRREAARVGRKHARYALYLFLEALRRREDFTVATVQAAFAAGFWIAARSITLSSADGHFSLVGGALAYRTARTLSR